MKPLSLCTMRRMPSTKSLQNWNERVWDPAKEVKGGATCGKSNKCAMMARRNGHLFRKW
jgi:hypothetical protein